MLNIGCHLSAAKGYMNMGKEAKSIDANTFQFFTRNPRGGKAKAIDEQDVKNFLEFMKENNFSQILAHAPYTLNACSNKEETREFALNKTYGVYTKPALQLPPGQSRRTRR